ncbi:right-handed parallel beta-helix repeat-containing protein [Candidatus Chloroploca sp. M-50]|uniref:Right-handed parallel beta-helix repeat-containing protein n=1 Tax=Candidatus Chloroploca mongolica TaxID=2528176 RepID=A0ABS4D9E2_9CHLR|nr:right-handed parallel beta-helix repeat-containing protein [Candidatus Chloroploca mongolica]MBP1466063.1 right-handed parallel beta-helix repeat-containing protein [Candidatus Chloroploca mongolica]
MAPRRHTLLLLTVVALVVASFGLVALLPAQSGRSEVVFFVDTLEDLDGDNGCVEPGPGRTCSLRQAIVSANAHPSSSDYKVITFRYFTDGPLATEGGIVRLDPLKPVLPKLTADRVEIIANDLFGIPKIQLDGNGRDVGFQLAGNESLIRGLSLYGFSDFGIEEFLGSAIYITGNNNRVERSFIGVNPDGQTLAGRQNFSGVRIEGSATGNVIGGAGGPGVANYISGNTQNGVIIRNASGNFVQNNFIGIVRENQSTTLVARGNGQYGVQIASISNSLSTDNVIGGTSAELANVIADNGQAGILLRGSGTITNFVQANYVGLDSANNDFKNRADGLLLEAGARNNRIGGSGAAPLVISNNVNYGIHLRLNGDLTRDNVIAGTTFIGTRTDGVTAFGNGRGGVLIAPGVTGTQIQGVGNSLRIAANGGPGVIVGGIGELAANNRIEQALIGLVPAPDGFQARPNALGGVEIVTSTMTLLHNNRIGGNTTSGVKIGPGATGVTLTGNAITSNTASGVLIQPDAADVTLIGNTISANATYGVHVGAGVQRTSLAGNTVADQTLAGVWLDGASNTTLITNTLTGNAAGGLVVQAASNTTITENVFGTNAPFGLRISASMTTTVDLNRVGLTMDTRTALGNLGTGIEVFDAQTTALTNNFVASNGGPGIVITGTKTRATNVQGNVTGLLRNAEGFARVASPNLGPQILVAEGPYLTLISGNTLAGDNDPLTAYPGIVISGTQTFTATVEANRIGFVPTAPPDGEPFLSFGHSEGIVVEGAHYVQIRNNNRIRRNDGAAIRLTDVMSATVTDHSADRAIFENGRGLVVTGNTQFVTLAQNELVANRGDAIALETVGQIADVLVRENTLRANQGFGILLNGNVQRVKLPGNRLSFNQAGGINFVRAAPSPAATNPNHDLAPPIIDLTGTDPMRLRVFDNGTFQGQVITATLEPGALPAPLDGCVTCTIEVFRPDPESLGQGLTSLVTVTASPEGLYSGQFENLTDTLELLLIATDVLSNSSEYGVFPVRRGMVFQEANLIREAIPDETLLFTLALSNTGTLNLVDLQVDVSAPLEGWTLVTDPVTSTLLTLADGEVKQLTFALTLPPGAHPNARAGLVNVLNVTVRNAYGPPTTARLETRVRAQPILQVDPLVAVGAARPGALVEHLHTLRNQGNVTVTANLAAVTRDAIGITELWTTTLPTTTVTLAPETEVTLPVLVRVPPGAQVLDPLGNPVQATTSVTATVPAFEEANPLLSYPELTLPFTATTRVGLAPDADLERDETAEAAAGGEAIFIHTVINQSNGTAFFCLVASTTKGSTVRFESATRDFVVDANGCFRLDLVNDGSQQPPRFREAQFRTIVSLDPRLLPDEREIVTLTLREASTEEVISDATLVNQITIVRGNRLPRVWLPLVQK